MIRLFLPKDSAAVAVGADAVADRLREAASARGLSIDLVRTGSRGMMWLEPLLEVDTPIGRVGFGPITAEQTGSVLDAALSGDDHPLRLGPVEALPWLQGQTRIVFESCGRSDPASIEDYRRQGGFIGLARARILGPDEVLSVVARSGLRGRGGAGFPTGVKWRTAAKAEASRRFIVCNADEGDSGTFADRMLMEGDPFRLIEGMAIAGLAVGAGQGFIYIRSEYPRAVEALRTAVRVAQADGVLGDFQLEVRVGAGAYVCGEETALLESLEGRRGQVRAKPPLPAQSGLFGAPTVINNVLTLAAVPWILREGAEAHAALGYGRSRGAQPLQLSGDVRFPGLYEAPFGLNLGHIIQDIGGGSASGRPIKAVQCGGPLGAWHGTDQFDLTYDYEAFAAADGLIGHGGLVVVNDTVNMARMARFALEFCAAESCGKCTPCRIGSVRGLEVMDRLADGHGQPGDLALIEDLCHTMKFGSLCALGGFTPYPVMSALKGFPEDFTARRADAGSLESQV